MIAVTELQIQVMIGFTGARLIACEQFAKGERDLNAHKAVGTFAGLKATLDASRHHWDGAMALLRAGGREELATYTEAMELEIMKILAEALTGSTPAVYKALASEAAEMRGAIQTAQEQMAAHAVIQ